MTAAQTHIARSVLMIEPVAFGFNPETAVNNFFQQNSDSNAAEIQKQALAEFSNMVASLRSKGIEVITVKDTPQPLTPDSIFPNNWISFDEDGQVVFYPMFAHNRRLERRLEIPALVEQNGHRLNNVVDFSFWEEENRFLEGTGSMILDRKNKIAYAALSQRTDKSVFLQYCNTFGFEPVTFTANQRVGAERKPVYHTNVMLCVADEFALICTQSIDMEQERSEVLNFLTRTNKVLIEISEEQMHAFAGNMLQLANASGQRFLVLSRTAYNALSDEQKNVLESFNELIICDVPTIEHIGGGSVRCMMAEVFC